MMAQEKSPPQGLTADGLGARGCLSHSARFVPKISDTPPVRQAHSHNPLWQRKVEWSTGETFSRTAPPMKGQGTFVADGLASERVGVFREGWSTCLTLRPSRQRGPCIPLNFSLSVSVRRVEVGETRAGHLGRGRSHDGGPPSRKWRHRGACANRQGARQAGCLAHRDREGVSQVAASPGHLSLSSGPDAMSEPYGLAMGEGDGASPRLPSLSPHHRAMKYNSYLRSKKWRKIRARALKRDKGKCRLCGRKATEVHHRDYERGTMDGCQMDRLYSVCRGCHELLTFDCVGERRSPKEMARKTRLLDEKSAPRSRSRKPKSRRHRMTIDEIRAASLEYAQGERRKG